MERFTTKTGAFICSGEHVCHADDECFCDSIEKALKKLSEYENLEEQGLLIRLPCKVGDAVYFVDRRYDRANNQLISFVHNGYVKAIKFSSRPTKVTIEYEDIDDRCGRCKGKDIHASNIGKTVFLTKEEAEAVLKEMEK